MLYKKDDVVSIQNNRGIFSARIVGIRPETKLYVVDPFVTSGSTQLLDPKTVVKESDIRGFTLLNSDNIFKGTLPVLKLLEDNRDYSTIIDKLGAYTFDDVVIERIYTPCIFTKLVYKGISLIPANKQHIVSIIGKKASNIPFQLSYFITFNFNVPDVESRKEVVNTKDTEIKKVENQKYYVRTDLALGSCIKKIGSNYVLYTSLADDGKVTLQEAKNIVNTPEVKNSEATFWIEKASDNLKGKILDIKYNKVVVTIKDSELKKINITFINYIARYLLKHYLTPEEMALTLNLKDNLFNIPSKVLYTIGGEIKYNVGQDSNEIVFFFNKQASAVPPQMHIYKKLTNSSLDTPANNTVYISLNKLISLISGEEQ